MDHWEYVFPAYMTWKDLRRISEEEGKIQQELQYTVVSKCY